MSVLSRFIFFLQLFGYVVPLLLITVSQIYPCSYFWMEKDYISLIQPCHGPEEENVCPPGPVFRLSEVAPYPLRGWFLFFPPVNCHLLSDQTTYFPSTSQHIHMCTRTHHLMTASHLCSCCSSSIHYLSSPCRLCLCPS